MNESGGLLKIETPDGGSTKLPAMPIEMNDRRFDVHQQVPKVGEHSKEILEEIGLSDNAIQSLFEKSIVS